MEGIDHAPTTPVVRRTNIERVAAFLINDGALLHHDAVRGGSTVTLWSHSQAPFPGSAHQLLHSAQKKTSLGMRLENVLGGETFIPPPLFLHTHSILLVFSQHLSTLVASNPIPIPHNSPHSYTHTHIPAHPLQISWTVMLRV